MIITFVSLKGGVGKTTCAIHIAAYLALKGQKTLLLDNDPSRYALGYDRNSGGQGLPFDVLPTAGALNKIPHYQNLIIDTEARPTDDDIAAYAQGCNLLIVPTTPSAMPLEGLGMLASKLAAIDDSAKWRALLTIVPPKPSKQGSDARRALVDAGIPLFDAEIPRAAAFDHASKVGLPAYKWDARGRRAWRQYELIGEEIDAIVNG